MKHLSELRIDLSCLWFNLEEIRKRIGAQREIMAVVKADAYGHGAERVALYLEKKGIHSFAVAQVFEGVRLRKAGVQGRILILQPGYHADLDSYREHGLECSISTLSDPEKITVGKPINCHLFVDSGMGREGIMPEHFEEAMSKIEAHESLNLVGIATHYAGSDEDDLDFAREQLSRFARLVESLPVDVRSRVQIHASNSGGITNLPEGYFDMVRPGILMYGQYTGSGEYNQKPAMSAYGKLVTVKDVPMGYPVGYGSTYQTSEATRLGIVSAGYADGYVRLRSGDASVWIRGQAYPVAGRVSMDALIIDLGLGSEAQEGDEVLLLGGAADEPSSIAYCANALQTITYERCCQLGLRMPRVYSE